MYKKKTIMAEVSISCVSVRIMLFKIICNKKNLCLNGKVNVIETNKKIVPS